MRGPFRGMPKVRRKVDSFYVAGPYTAATDEAVKDNVERAIAVGEELLKLDLVVYVPHFAHFWEMRHPHSYETWMNLDFGMIPKFSALFRMPDASEGADREVQLAQRLGIPVFYDLAEVKAAMERGYVEVDVPLTAVCWFCAKTREQVQLLVTCEGFHGVPGTSICDECIGLANGLMAGAPGACIRLKPVEAPEVKEVAVDPVPVPTVQITVTPVFPIQSLKQVPE